jgi:subtilisin family serine protease
MKQTSISNHISCRRLLLITGSSILALFLATISPADSSAGFTELSDDSSRPSTAFSNRSTRLERGVQVARLGAEPWHRAGSVGRGIKVAVLDSGFRGYKSFLGDVIPANVKVRSFRHDGNLEFRNSQHGIICGEVIHALAPDAELLFANWEAEEPSTFLAAVSWARKEGAQIISCSVIMPSWSDGNGGGAVHQTLAKLLGDGRTSGDMLCFASAGNTAERHWVGDFRKAKDGFHEWHTGTTSNLVRPWGKDQVSLELYAPAGSARFEVSVHDADSGAVIGKAASSSEGERTTAVVRFNPDSLRSYSVRVRRLTSGPSRFHVVALGAELDIATTESSVAFPADGAEVIGVGAVDEDNRRMSYSSCGPNSSHTKPDLVATVPFMTFCRARPFAGTSAAAPQAAGLAALLWSEHRTWKAQDVSRYLLKATSDLGQPGPDFETGHGRLRLPQPSRTQQAKK